VGELELRDPVAGIADAEETVLHFQFFEESHVLQHDFVFNLSDDVFDLQLVFFGNDDLFENEFVEEGEVLTLYQLIQLFLALDVALHYLAVSPLQFHSWVLQEIGQRSDIGFHFSHVLGELFCGIRDKG
jgi:hypothetical protein